MTNSKVDSPIEEGQRVLFKPERRMAAGMRATQIQVIEPSIPEEGDSSSKRKTSIHYGLPDDYRHQTGQLKETKRE